MKDHIQASLGLTRFKKSVDSCSYKSSKRPFLYRQFNRHMLWENVK